MPLPRGGSGTRARAFGSGHTVTACAVLWVPGVAVGCQFYRLEAKYTIIGYLTDGIVQKSVESEAARAAAQEAAAAAARSKSD